jgi:hypothetical protein
VLLLRLVALLASCFRAKLWRPKEVATQGHVRKRAPAGSWGYILDVGRYRAPQAHHPSRAHLRATQPPQPAGVPDESLAAGNRERRAGNDALGLSHKSIAMTGDVYSHCLPEQDDAAAAIIASGIKIGG